MDDGGRLAGLLGVGDGVLGEVRLPVGLAGRARGQHHGHRRGEQRAVGRRDRERIIHRAEC